MTERLANELLELVLLGKKQATASSLLAYHAENNRVPQLGDYSVVTDWNGIPHCVIETTSVTILPFKEITYEICKREGEDDTLESWQIGHRNFFTQDGNALGYQFTDDMPVVFEDFKVVYSRKLKQAEISGVALMDEKEITVCNEYGSSFLKASSRMEKLCLSHY